MIWFIWTTFNVLTTILETKSLHNIYGILDILTFTSIFIQKGWGIIGYNGWLSVFYMSIAFGMPTTSTSAMGMSASLLTVIHASDDDRLMPDWHGACIEKYGWRCQAHRLSWSYIRHPMMCALEHHHYESTPQVCFYSQYSVWLFPCSPHSWAAYQNILWNWKVCSGPIHTKATFKNKIFKMNIHIAIHI